VWGTWSRGEKNKDFPTTGAHKLFVRAVREFYTETKKPGGDEDEKSRVAIGKKERAGHIFLGCPNRITNALQEKGE